MVNKLKIITMTRLALYDKHDGPADRVANDYFRHDYIYRNNLGTRLSVGLGSIIILMIYWLRALVANELDIFSLDIQQHVTDSVLFILAVLAVYSLIGSIQGTRQYYLVQKRLAQYQAMVRQLERQEERAKRSINEDEANQGQYRQQDDNTVPIYNPTPPVRTSSEHTRPLEHTRHPEPRSHTRHPEPLEHTRHPERSKPLESTSNPVHTKPPRPRNNQPLSPPVRRQNSSYSAQSRPPRPRRQVSYEDSTPLIEHTRHSNPIEHTRHPDLPIEHTRPRRGPKPQRGPTSSPDSTETTDL